VPPVSSGPGFTPFQAQSWLAGILLIKTCSS
jgi:hypothetical protein